MEPKEARAYLRTLYNELKQDGDMNKWAEAIQVALDAVAPPIGAGYCQWVYLPDKDMLPKEHLNTITKIQNAVDKLETAFREGDCAPVGELAVNEEWTEILEMALVVYHSVLMQVNKAEIMEGLKGTVEAIGKAQKEGKFDEPIEGA